MSELCFIDKLREATKEGVPDSQLVDECMELVNKFAPNIANEISNDMQAEMLDVAHRQRNSIEFNSLDQLKNIVSWSYGMHNTKIEQKFNELYQAALKNTKVNILNGLEPWLTWEIKGNKYGLQLDTSEKEITIMFAPSWKTTIKIFENLGFKVTPEYNRSVWAHEITGITVEW